MKQTLAWTITILLIAALFTPIHLHSETIRVGSGGFTPLHSIIWAAHHQGVFKKYGFDVEYLALNSGTLGAQTLLSNEIQFLFSTRALAVTANLQGGDMTMVSGGFNFFAFKLVSCLTNSLHNCRDISPKISPYPSFPKRGLGVDGEESPFEKGGNREI